MARVKYGTGPPRVQVVNEKTGEVTTWECRYRALVRNKRSLQCGRCLKGVLGNRGTKCKCCGARRVE